MNQQNIPAKYGLLISAGTAATYMALYVSGYHTTKIESAGVAGLLQYVFPLIGIPIGLRDYRAAYFGDRAFDMTRGLKAGLMLSFIYALLSTLFAALYVTSINPAYLPARTDYVLESYKQAGLSEAELAVRAEQIRSAYSTLSYCITELIQNLAVGLFITAITAVSLQRKSG